MSGYQWYRIPVSGSDYRKCALLTGEEAAQIAGAELDEEAADRNEERLRGLVADLSRDGDLERTYPITAQIPRGRS